MPESLPAPGLSRGQVGGRGEQYRGEPGSGLGPEGRGAVNKRADVFDYSGLAHQFLCPDQVRVISRSGPTQRGDLAPLMAEGSRLAVGHVAEPTI